MKIRTSTILAAEQGDSDAAADLGFCYDIGIGTPVNMEQAVIWYQRAASQNVARAQYNLGCCYEDAEGVSKDMDQAMYWYQKAAMQGNESAKAALERLNQ